MKIPIPLATIFGVHLLAGIGNAVASPARSVQQWAVCGGKTDDSEAMAAAFRAASQEHFTLVVDCPIYIHIGIDVSRPIFVDSGTNVIFSGSGEFILDNTLIPAFALINSHIVNFRGWRVVYEGGLPVDMNTGYYVDAGRFVASDAEDPPAAAFQKRETKWLVSQRGVSFLAGAKAPWHGPTNTSAIFFLDGDTSGVTMTDMRLSVPTKARGDQFIPMVFSMTYGAKTGASVSPVTPITTAQFAVPGNLRFSDVMIDGAYMGWQGNARNLSINRVRSLRYGDLQDAQGGEIGGQSIVDGQIARWFAPPHLIYLNYQRTWDPQLYNRNIHISDVIDYGVRVGSPRDNQGNCCSGNALSLKIGAVDSDVTGYVSYRPDGLLDVLDSDHLLLRDITGSYNSGFLNNLYPGIRFPGCWYNDVTLQDVTLTDTAAVTTRAPVVLAKQQAQHGTVMKNVLVRLNRWNGSTAYPAPNHLAAIDDDISIDYDIGGAVLNYQN